MNEPILQVRQLVKRFGSLTATNHLDLTVVPGEVHAVIGPNGAGKTTLLGQIAGELKPDSGTIHFNGVNITHRPDHHRVHMGLARSFQITNLFTEFTVLENVMLAVQAQDGHSFRFWRPAQHDPSLREPALAILEEVDLRPRADAMAASLSHGEQRQLEIAIALTGQPKLLMLDEPMAGMGPVETQRMIEILQELRHRLTILLIEHDMDAVFSLADRISVVVYGDTIATGTPEDIRANEEVRQAYLGDTFSGPTTGSETPNSPAHGSEKPESGNPGSGNP